MPTLSTKSVIFIIVSLIVAMILTILPLPQWASYARPQWILMLLLFWMVALPSQPIGVVTVFFLGLLMDLLTGTVLGQQAFSLLLVSYGLLTLLPNFWRFPLWRQTLVMVPVTLGYLFTMVTISSIFAQTTWTPQYFLSVATSVVIWPWLSLIQKDFFQRLREPS